MRKVVIFEQSGYIFYWYHRTSPAKAVEILEDVGMLEALEMFNVMEMLNVEELLEAVEMFETM